MRFAVALTLLAGFIALVVAAGSGCLGSEQFKCSTNVDCTRASAQGRCEPVGFCSFDDATCGGGRRFGDLSGPFANECLPPPDAAPPDAPIDAALDAFVPDARECFGSGAYMMCFAGMPPMGTVALVGALDTATDPRCAAMMPQSWLDAGQPDSCLIMGKTINVTGALLVTGARPLVLLGDVITIGGVIDVASHRGATTATPGAPASQCAAFPTAPVSHFEGGGGGAGGSFMLRGGNGGRGRDGSALGGTAAPNATVAPTVLRGGCPGQPGALAVAGTVGTPGQGGGALFITASNLTITASGGINASGAGAIGGTANAGGSGGGAGGMIVLHVVENLNATGARLLANGGGGSAGADNGTGSPGADPVATTPTTAAAGGSGPGAAGGDGFAGTTQAQSGNNANGARDSGGGGGGGGGYIQSNKAISGAIVSPAATVVP